ncbi:MAG: glycosyltransferase family 39 protein [Myxococcota bacterium]|nr:glycosyltransferase family 39 protein [Myxococcota bacterium]
MALAVPAVVFAPSLGFDWVYDDHRQIVANTDLESFNTVLTAWTQNVWANAPETTEARYYRPVFVIWLVILRHLPGTGATGAHLGSLLLHLGVIAVLWGFLRRYTGSRLVASAAALLFAVHPTRGESVAWVSGGGDGLAALFGFGALWCLLTARPSLTAQVVRAPRLRGQLLAMVLYALAVFSKETAIGFLAFPALLALFGAPHRPLRPRIFDAIRVTMPWICVTLIYLLCRSSVIGELAPTRILVEPDQINPTTLLLLGTYLQHLVAPDVLSISYPIKLIDNMTSPESQAALRWVYGGVVVWVGLLALPVLTNMRPRISRATPLLLLGVFFLLPVLRFSTLSADALFQDRYLYLPSACLLTAVAWFLVEMHRWAMHKNRLLLFGLPILGIALLGCSAYRLGSNLPAWKNDLTLWSRAVEVNPKSSVAWFNRGVHFENNANLDQAEHCYAKATSLEPNRAIFHFRLAFMLAERRENQRAKHHFIKAAALRPEDPMILYEAARIEAAIGDPRRALRFLDQAVRSINHGTQPAGDVTRGAVLKERQHVLSLLESGVSRNTIEEEAEGEDGTEAPDSPEPSTEPETPVNP